MAATPERIKVLLVEDDEDDYTITRDMLAAQDRARFEVEWCSSYETALAAIAQERHDVYLIDYRLGGNTGLDLVREAFARRSRAPVLILTGQADYEVDLQASSLGATDFLLKQELRPYALERSIRYAISHQQALTDLAVSEERYALAACAVNDGIWDWDLSTGKVYYSPRWEVLLGLPEIPREGDTAAWFDRVHEEDLSGLQLAIEAHLSGRTSLLQSKHRMRHTDGTWRWMLARGMAVRDATGNPVRMAGSLSDITVARMIEHRLQYDALHDSLTALPNRALFMDRLERALARTKREPGRSCALIFLDIDRFKLVNDTFSHSVGDQLLIAIAHRISSELRPSDTVARLGGDEFTVLLDDLLPENAEKPAVEVVERMHHALSGQFDVDGRRLFVTCSTGIALPSEDMTASELLRNADIAMYEAKHGGRARYAVFDASMHRRIADRLTHHNALREAIEQSLIRVYYQPVIELETGRIHGFEALARWPEGWPALAPSEFIPLAEETGLITSLGLHVLRVALSTLASWRRSGLVAGDVRMSVNVSGAQLDEPSFPDDVLDAILSAGVPGAVVRLEITEGTLMREPDRMSRVASDVCATGVGLELDDFGTGYSSLAALHRFPVNALKVDQGFVACLGVGGGSEAIVRSTVALGQSLGLEVIAEGIETENQLQILRSLGCRLGQGHFFFRPGSAPEIEQILRSRSQIRRLVHDAPLAPANR
jgi:diguanylate cyclase (GGDEF)-like protein/PAS domain S-box-containing protein